ncbi:MAG: sulfite exporter TauE/SafE family protein [Deltaproteobacteria bacterium]
MTDLQFKLLLTAVAFGTSIVSGMLGMAGGLILLSALLSGLDPLIAVPVHGIVQLVSNGSRAWLLRQHVNWQAVLRFAWPLLPAGALGLLLLQRMPAAVGRILIGLFVLLATWLPTSTRGAGPSPTAWRGLPVGGALVGFFSTLVGATGPLLGPFIVALELGPQGTIGTLAGCQIFQHASKVLLFGLGGFDFGAYLLWTLGLCLAALLGTAVGTRFLDNLRPATFKRVIRLVISALALQLLASGTWDLVTPARSSASP